MSTDRTPDPVPPTDGPATAPPAPTGGRRTVSVADRTARRESAPVRGESGSLRGRCRAPGRAVGPDSGAECGAHPVSSPRSALSKCAGSPAPSPTRRGQIRGNHVEAVNN